MLAVVLVTVFLPGSAFAYIGPGGGLSAVGAFLGLLAGIIVAIFGFVWYPIKRLLKRRREKRERHGEGEV